MWWALWLAVTPTLSLALDPSKAPTQYRLDAWSSDDGLPQNTVHGIVQTPDGYVWLATEEGLVRFDGTRFVVFDKRNTPGIGGNYFFDLMVSRDGTLWLAGYGAGLVRVDAKGFHRYGVAEGLASDRAVTLFEDRAGVIWVGSEPGLSRLENGKLRNVSGDYGLAGERVNAIAQTSDGAMWIGTADAGLLKIGATGTSRFDKTGPLGSSRVYGLLAEGSTIWIGTSEGLARLEGDELRRYGELSGLGGGGVVSLARDRAGSLWLGTQKGGLWRFHGGTFQGLTTRQGLPSDVVRTLFEDREGSLWVGTAGGGVAQLKDAKFTAYTTKEGLSDDVVYSVLEDRSGRLWWGTASGGLQVREKGVIRRFTTADGLTSDTAFSLAEGRDGSLWIGAAAGGVNRWKDGVFTAYGRAHGLPDAKSFALYEDRAGALWAGVQGKGLYRVKDDKVTRFAAPDRLPTNDVNVVVEGEDGVIWVGTEAGLVRIEGDLTRIYGERDGLTAKALWSIYPDPDGTLWIGTLGQGLLRFRQGKFSAVTTREGLPDDVVFQILEDGHQHLWMSSNKGIFRVAKADLVAVAEGRSSKVASLSFGKADGMKTDECNGGTQPSGFKTREGKLWFPTVKGLVEIDPAKIPRNEVAPLTVIEALTVDQKAYAVDATVELPAGAKKLEVRYTGLSFVAPRKVSFSYQLEGFDPDWVPAENRRVAYYTNLPHGHYRFRVRATNNDGVPDERGAAISFVLPPRFFETWWFFTLCALAVAAIATSGYRLRMRQLRRTHQQEVERKALEKDMELTATVQSFFLPRAKAIDSETLQLSAFNRPADKCSGDWWWYDVRENGRLFVLIGDVTGHGAPAAMITAAVAGAFRVLDRGGRKGTVPELFDRLNTELLDICRGQYCMTVSAFEIDPAAGTVEVWGAGGPTVLVQTHDGKVKPMMLRGGALGTAEYKLGAMSRPLAPGDRVFIYTDGLSEQRLSDGRELGMKKIFELLGKTRSDPLDGAITRLMEEVDVARGAERQEDDITLVLVELKGDAPTRVTSPERRSAG